jgi:hypothetical protein
LKPAVPGMRKAGARRAGKADSSPEQAVNTQSSRAGAAGSTNPLTYDLVYPWGISSLFNGWASGGGGQTPINKLWAHPHFFPRDCILKSLTMDNQISGASVGIAFKLGIYANVASGVPYPGAKLIEWAEQTPLLSGIQIWNNINLSIAGGTLLWTVEIGDNHDSAYNLASLGGAQREQTIIGITSAMNTSPIIGWSQDQVYDGTLPALYPQTTPTPLLTSHQGEAYFMRFG